MASADGLRRAVRGLSDAALRGRFGTDAACAQTACAICGGEGGKPKLAGRVEVDDAYLGGERSGGKRGRGAAGKTPVVAAVETTAERKPKRLRLTVVKGFRKRKVERLAERDLEPGSAVVSD